MLFDKWFRDRTLSGAEPEALLLFLWHLAFSLHPSLVRGCSSVGRAVALQAIGQEFESPQLHQLPNAGGGVRNAECSQFRTPHSEFRIRNGRVAQLVRARA